jgi:hypothetical protein
MRPGRGVGCAFCHAAHSVWRNRSPSAVSAVKRDWGTWQLSQKTCFSIASDHIEAERWPSSVRLSRPPWQSSQVTPCSAESAIIWRETASLSVYAVKSGVWQYWQACRSARVMVRISSRRPSTVAVLNHASARVFQSAVTGTVRSVGW